MNTKTIINAAALVLGLLGVFFKVEQWAGADILLLAGFGLLLISTLAFTAGENTAAGAPSGLSYAIVAALTVGILAAVFKVLHWQGGDMVVLVSMALLVAVCAMLLASSAKAVASRQLLTVVFVYITLAFAVVYFLRRPAPASPAVATTEEVAR